MAFNITTFKSNGLVQGGARPSLFEVFLAAPGVAGGLEQGGRFLIKAAQLPASTVASIDIGYFGRKVKVAGDRTFNDWTVTVMNDEDFLIRDVLESWSNQINQMEGNKMLLPSNISGGAAASSYKQDLIVRQFTKNQPDSGDVLPIRQYKFIGAFPTSIDAIQLDWDRTNQVEEFDVTFAYDYWIPLDPASYTEDVGVVTT